MLYLSLHLSSCCPVIDCFQFCRGIRLRATLNLASPHFMAFLTFIAFVAITITSSAFKNWSIHLIDPVLMKSLLYLVLKETIQFYLTLMAMSLKLNRVSNLRRLGHSYFTHSTVSTASFFSCYFSEGSPAFPGFAATSSYYLNSNWPHS